MICSIRHRGLRRLHVRGDRRGLPPALVPKILRILSNLSRAQDPHDLQLPGYRLHALSGNREGFWSVDVTASLRIVFRHEDGNAYDVDLVDYHRGHGRG